MIEDLTIKEIREINEMLSGTPEKKHPYKIGENYIIRTVTMINLGRLESVWDQELVLSSATWIPETARWSNCLHEGKLREVEPFPDGEIIVGRGAIIDAAIWHHPLPREQK